MSEMGRSTYEIWQECARCMPPEVFEVAELLIDQGNVASAEKLERSYKGMNRELHRLERQAEDEACNR